MPAGIIKATNITGSGTYNFSCAALTNADSYYRLQIADKDGSITHSKVIKLQRSGNGVIVSYNSAGKQISIINNSTAVCEWKLFAANGNPVKQGSSTNHTLQISTAGLASGIYIILCRTNGKPVNTRIAVF